MHTPLTTKSRSSVGDRRTNRFAAVFDDSDSDNDAEVTVTRAAVTAPESESHNPIPAMLAAFMDDPVMRDLWEGKKSWGDIVYEDDVRNGRIQHWVPEPRPAVTTEMDLWNAFEDTDLDEHISDVYNTRGLTDAEFDRFMSWLYTNGWEVESWERTWVRAWPVFDGPPNWPQEWKGLSAELRAREPVRAPEPEHHHHGHGCCGGGAGARAEPARLSAPGTDNGRRKGAPVPRFCKDGKRCATAGCRYVHGDTIQRLNEQCSFGAACGAGDPKKRSQCLRMHPGEKWDPRLVINRV